MPNYRRLRVITPLLAATVLLLGSCSSAGSSTETVSTDLEAELTFKCLWWSEAQMEGLNPNSPPPKNTEVNLTKWEYSDPIGVPHPDVVDLVATLKNRGRTAVSGVGVEVAGQWKAGPLHDSSSAAWGERSLFKTFSGISIPAGGTQVLRVPVNLKEVMTRLEKQEKWPYALRVTVTARQLSQRLTEAHAELPIMPGD